MACQPLGVVYNSRDFCSEVLSFEAFTTMDFVGQDKWAVLGVHSRAIYLGWNLGIFCHLVLFQMIKF